jgi:undecaprenyl pyrophosphate synthase
MKMEVLVRGTVARKVIVEGNSIAECEAKAFCEWAAAVGGDYTTAEALSGIKIDRPEEEAEI